MKNNQSIKERVTPFEYIEGNSIFHRLNALVKLFMIFSVTALVITFLDPVAGIIINIAIYIMFVISKATKAFIMINKRVVLLMGGTFATLYFIFYTVIPYILYGNFSEMGFVWAASGLYRLANLIGIVGLFAATTRIIDLSVSLPKLGIPPRIATVVGLAFGMVPLFTSQLKDIIDAYEARGFKIKHPNPIKRIISYISILPPTMLTTIRVAQWMSVALEMRGFTYPGKKTYRAIKSATLTIYDKIAIAINILIIISAAYISQLRLPTFPITQPLYHALLQISPLYLILAFLLTISFVLYNIIRPIK
jgi:energy-coupling factor transport system permease protein